MAAVTTIQLWRGLRAELPLVAAAGVPLLALDTGELFVGTGSGVEPVGIDASAVIGLAGVVQAQHDQLSQYSVVTTGALNAAGGGFPLLADFQVVNMDGAPAVTLDGEYLFTLGKKYVVTTLGGQYPVTLGGDTAATMDAM